MTTTSDSTFRAHQHSFIFPVPNDLITLYIGVKLGRVDPPNVPRALPIMTQNMETVASRLASFDLVLQPEKRRNSSTKAAEPIAWPHRSPSPTEVHFAHYSLLHATANA